VDEPESDVDFDLDSAQAVTELLDGIPGAYESAQRGLREAEEGKALPLDDL
jgi:hypothetical protein